MRRLRLVAAGVAILTALVDWLLALNPAVHGGVIALVALAAACLAAFTPFDSLEPPARKLAFVACLVFLVCVSLAFALTVQAKSAAVPLASIGAMVTVGVALSVWSFAIRNRRRRAGWRNYYDI